MCAVVFAIHQRSVNMILAEQVLYSADQQPFPVGSALVEELVRVGAELLDEFKNDPFPKPCFR